MDASVAQLPQRPIDTQPLPTASEEKSFDGRAADDMLERRHACCDSDVSEQDVRPTSDRQLGKGFPEQVDVDSPAKNGGTVEAEMTVSAFVRLVNASGFGEVLTERQLLRQRRAFPAINTGRGKVNVIAYLASICSRRRRSRRDGELCVSDLAAMLEQQRYRCVLTGERLTPENLAVDHIVPISEGGSFAVDNSQLVTKAVNRAKHTMSQEDFLMLCDKVAATSSRAV
jgi:hypothetical protein